MMTINKNILIRLNGLLGLDSTGQEQDWAIEFADANRVSNFIEIMKETEITDEEKYAMMSLILASFDDRLNTELPDNSLIWTQIVTLLDNDREQYNELTAYWALSDDDSERQDWFAITPLIRQYRDNAY